MLTPGLDLRPCVYGTLQPIRDSRYRLVVYHRSHIGKDVRRIANF